MNHAGQTVTPAVSGGVWFLSVLLGQAVMTLTSKYNKGQMNCTTCKLTKTKDKTDVDVLA